jgi:transposase
MAYREVRMSDIDQVIRRWLAGDKIRAIARSTGSDRNTVRRILRFAGEAGIRGDTLWPDESKLQAIRQRMGRPGTSVALSEAEQRLQPRSDQIRAWLEEDHLLLTKVHELLGREGLVVSYSALYRFARKWCDFGPAASITVRRAESSAGEMAEADFGRLGLLQELGSCRPRMVHGFILTLGYSRLSCVIPVFKQDLPTVIDCFEHALAFFNGCPRRIVIDGMKACIDQSDPYTPRLNRTFLEYATYRGFLPDPARPAHAQDKPLVENSVRYVRERFFKGESFIDLDDVARRALVWCQDVAGRRIHGTTRRVPWEVFESEEKPLLIPLQAERFDTPSWAQCKVHPDHHVRFGQALYSVPTRWIGCQVDVRGDRSLVRIYVHGELIKTHERKPSGGRSTDYTDYPDGRAPYALRWPNYYSKRARELGPAAGDFTDKLLSGEFPWSRLRQAQKLLRLAERYGAARLESACRRALDFDLLDVYRVQRILEQGLESQSEPQPIVAGQQTALPLQFLRPAQHFVSAKGGPHADPA